MILRARKDLGTRSREKEKRRKKKWEKKKTCRAVLDGTIGYSRGRTSGGGRGGSVESMLSKTAKERVHMYAGDVGT